MTDGLPEKLLNSLEESRRSFLSKLILGTAFVVPGVASFSMSGLGIDEALAACGNQFSGNQFCFEQPQPPDAVRSLPGNYSGYDYSRQNFKNLNLTNRCFFRTNFAGANLSDANLSCDFLESADLAGANLSNANLTGAVLVRANLQGATLTNTNLSGASLGGATLTGANLTGANLAGADLRFADLTGANLTGVRWSNTTCPDGSNSDANGGTCPV